MWIIKIEAFKDSKGGIHPLETSALQAEIIIITGFNAASANNLMDNAAKLIPLLQRHAAMQAEKPKPAAPSADATTLSASDEREAIPSNTYYSREHDNFYDTVSKRGQGNGFHAKWIARRDEFPPEPKDS